MPSLDTGLSFLDTQKVLQQLPKVNRVSWLSPLDRYASGLQGPDLGRQGLLAEQILT